MSNQPEHIRQALEAHRQALEELENSFLKLEQILVEGQGVAEPPSSQGSSELLSVMEVCQELSMGKSWVHQRIKSGEIPSIRLGNNIKVRRNDLAEYIESQRYQSAASQEGE